MAIMNIHLRDAADAYRKRSAPAESVREAVHTEPDVAPPTNRRPAAKAPSAKAPSAKAPSAKGPTAKGPTVKAPTVNRPAVKAPPANPALSGPPKVMPLGTMTPHPSDRWKTADEWKMLAECGPADTELFFSKDPVEKRAALAICGDCPVVSECLAEAMSQERGVDLHGRYGIRGGTTPVQRRELARTWKDRSAKSR